MQTINKNDINAEDLFVACQQAQEPLLITNIYDAMPHLAGITPEGLEKKLVGSRMVVVRSGASQFFDISAKFVKMEFTDFMNAIMRPEGSDKPEKLYMQTQSIEHQFPELQDELTIDQVLPQTALKKNKLVVYKKLWIGPGGSVTPLHFDLYDNYFIQMFGKKTFYLYSPSDLPSLYPYGPLTKYPYVSRINPAQPDLKKFPKISNATLHKVTVEPGTILYLPSYWLHQVEGDVGNVNISVNMWLSRGVPKMVPGFFNVLPAFILRAVIGTAMQATQALKSLFR